MIIFSNFGENVADIDFNFITKEKTEMGILLFQKGEHGGICFIKQPNNLQLPHFLILLFIHPCSSNRI